MSAHFMGYLENYKLRNLATIKEMCIYRLRLFPTKVGEKISAMK